MLEPSSIVVKPLKGLKTLKKNSVKLIWLFPIAIRRFPRIFIEKTTFEEFEEIFGQIHIE